MRYANILVFLGQKQPAWHPEIKTTEADWQSAQYEESKRKAPSPIKEKGKFICQIISREKDETF